MYLFCGHNQQMVDYKQIIVATPPGQNNFFMAIVATPYGHYKYFIISYLRYLGHSQKRMGEFFKFKVE